MTSDHRIPFDLRMVSWLFIAAGIFLFADINTGLMNGSLLFNVGVVQIFTGFGVLRLKRFWKNTGYIFIAAESTSAAMALLLDIESASQYGAILFNSGLMNWSEKTIVIVSIVTLLTAVLKFLVLKIRTQQGFFS